MTEPVQGLFLVVDDIETAREDLIGRGVDVSEIWHLDLAKGPQPGPDPEGNTYANRASFADPDGNQWVLQQITERLPGRVERTDPAPLGRAAGGDRPAPRRLRGHRARRTTGGTGTPPTSPPARTATRPSRPTRPPTRTWRRPTMSWFPDEVAALEALEERVSRRLRRR